MVKVEGDTKVKRRLFSWYHPYDGCPTRKTMLEQGVLLYFRELYAVWGGVHVHAASRILVIED